MREARRRVRRGGKCLGGGNPIASDAVDQRPVIRGEAERRYVRAAGATGIGRRARGREASPKSPNTCVTDSDSHPASLVRTAWGKAGRLAGCFADLLFAMARRCSPFPRPVRSQRSPERRTHVVRSLRRLNIAGLLRGSAARDTGSALPKKTETAAGKCPSGHAEGDSLGGPARDSPRWYDVKSSQTVRRIPPKTGRNLKLSRKRPPGMQDGRPAIDRSRGGRKVANGVAAGSYSVAFSSGAIAKTVDLFAM